MPASIDQPTMTKRTALVITLNPVKAPHQSVIIANTHLPGGRFDEARLNSETSVKTCNDIKTTLVKDVVGLNPNIVLGDFNSDVMCFTTGKVNPKQREFWVQTLRFPDDEDTTKKLMEWNCAPYRVLQDNGYTIECQDECPAKFKENPTSFYGTTPDAIWFKGVGFQSFQQMSLMQDPMLSDHDALIADFKLG